jgi:glycosyltransferase involved in cell wall biosynthesis
MDIPSVAFDRRHGAAVGVSRTSAPRCSDSVDRDGETSSSLRACPHIVICEEMRHARAFVQHSIEAPSGDSEGTPVSVLEAGASGLPIVATRHGESRTVVIEETTGLLVGKHDVQGMANTLRRLIHDPALTMSMGEAARDHVRTHFAMEHGLDRLWAIIASCIDGRDPPGSARLHGNPFRVPAVKASTK